MIVRFVYRSSSYSPTVCISTGVQVPSAGHRSPAVCPDVCERMDKLKNVSIFRIRF